METRRTFPVPFKDFGQGNNIHLPRISTLSASLRYLPTTYLFLRIYTSGILRIAHKYEHFLSFSFYTIHCQVDLINRKDMIPHVFSCNANCAITFFLQVSKTVLYFSDVLWPEFTIWNLLGAIIHFQRYAPQFKVAKSLNEDKKRFLKNLEKQRWLDLEKFVSCTS